MLSAHIEISGIGSDVVLLHGTPMAPAHLRRLARDISATHRTSIVHLPGYGETPPLPAGHTVTDIQESVERGLATHGVEEAVLVGISGGAYHALSLALRGKVRVTRVMALSGLAGFDAAKRESFRGFAQALREGVDLTAAVVASMLPTAFVERNPGAVEEVRGWACVKDPLLLADELEAFAVSPDLTPRLSELHIPILARVGDLDVSTPVAQSEAIVRAAPNARLEVVPGVGHVLLLEDLEGTVESVLRALSS